MSLEAIYGKNVLIDNNVYVADDVSIGKYSYINRNSSAENCEIGAYCSISSGVYINPYEHMLSGISTHPKFEKKSIANEKEKSNHRQ